MITLKTWDYEHIAIAHPLGLPMPSFDGNLEYEASIVIWHDDFYIHLSYGFRHDVAFYRIMLSQLVLDHVRFRPYHLYPA